MATVVGVVPAKSLADDGLLHKGFRLLALGGLPMKWGKPRFRTPANIRYAFLTSDLDRKGATNCRSMRPFPAFLGTDKIRRSAVVREFERGFAAWHKVAAIQFERVKDVENADLVLGIQEKPRGIAYADVSPGAEPTGSFYTIRKAAICLNPGLAWETGFDGNDRTFDIQFIAVHEIGHVIGLDHAGGNTPRVMSHRYRENVRSPQIFDIAGAGLLYGHIKEQYPIPSGVARADVPPTRQFEADDIQPTGVELGLAGEGTE